jgi:hypothetical protein
MVTALLFWPCYCLRHAPMSRDGGLVAVVLLRVRLPSFLGRRVDGCRRRGTAVISSSRLLSASRLPLACSARWSSIAFRANCLISIPPTPSVTMQHSPSDGLLSPAEIPHASSPHIHNAVRLQRYRAFSLVRSLVQSPGADPLGNFNLGGNDELFCSGPIDLHYW